MVERTFAFLKQTCPIFDKPWKREKWLLPITLRVCLKLCNLYWRRNENMALGLHKLLKEIEE